MSSKADELKELYLNVVGQETTIDSQKEGPSHEPIEAEETESGRSVTAIARNDGLSDALDGSGESS